MNQPLTTAAIYASGPSLQTLVRSGPPAANIHIAVNTAIFAPLPAMYWVFGDRSMYERGHHLFDGICVTGLEVAHTLVYDWREFEHLAHQPFRFSIEAALYFAAFIHVDLVHLFGVDLHGVEDFRGEAIGNRSAERWAIESTLVHQAIHRLTTVYGMRVCWHRPKSHIAANTATSTAHSA
ncbi:MAG: hypothetical protein ABQ298_03660 [Puniceicoccaceae bacterium]